MTTTTDRAELFTDEQRVRAAALDAARAVLAKTGFASGELDVPTSDLIDVAEYIITGVHPLAGFGEATPAVLTAVDNVAEHERCEGCASTEITAHDSDGVPLCFSCDKATSSALAARAEAGDPGARDDLRRRVGRVQRGQGRPGVEAVQAQGPDGHGRARADPAARHRGRRRVGGSDDAARAPRGRPARVRERRGVARLPAARPRVDRVFRLRAGAVRGHA